MRIFVRIIRSRRCRISSGLCSLSSGVASVGGKRQPRGLRRLSRRSARKGQHDGGRQNAQSAQGPFRRVRLPAVPCGAQAGQKRLSRVPQERVGRDAREIGLTVTEMARTIGATRTAVSLTLTRWESEGRLVRRNGVRCVTRSLLESTPDWLTGGGPCSIKPIQNCSFWGFIDLSALC